MLMESLSGSEACAAQTAVSPKATGPPIRFVTSAPDTMGGWLGTTQSSPFTVEPVSPESSESTGVAQQNTFWPLATWACKTDADTPGIPGWLSVSTVPVLQSPGPVSQSISSAVSVPSGSDALAVQLTGSPGSHTVVNALISGAAFRMGIVLESTGGPSASPSKGVMRHHTSSPFLNPLLIVVSVPPGSSDWPANHCTLGVLGSVSSGSAQWANSNPQVSVCPANAALGVTVTWLTLGGELITVTSAVTLEQIPASCASATA